MGKSQRKEGTPWAIHPLGGGESGERGDSHDQIPSSWGQWLIWIGTKRGLSVMMCKSL